MSVFLYRLWIPGQAFGLPGMTYRQANSSVAVRFRRRFVNLEQLFVGLREPFSLWEKATDEGR
jgi:hypothetical protein